MLPGRSSRGLSWLHLHDQLHEWMRRAGNLITAGLIEAVRINFATAQQRRGPAVIGGGHGVRELVFIAPRDRSAARDRNLLRHVGRVLHYDTRCALRKILRRARLEAAHVQWNRKLETVAVTRAAARRAFQCAGVGVADLNGE